MCGIVGIRLHSGDLMHRLGELVAPMLEVLASRGPDSTGLAIYSHDLTGEPVGSLRYSVWAPTPYYDWDTFGQRLRTELGVSVTAYPWGRDAVLVAGGVPDVVLAALGRIDPSVRVFGWGTAIALLKDVGPASDVCERYGVRAMSGYQAIGHTRMATESAVTVEHSHPFAVASDLALVHNGSFSNYASVRRDLVGDGVRFDTDNDSEVAARFVAARLGEGADLRDALRGAMKAFDGFFTLLVATADSMAIVRDSFACKPMVVAETSDYVAVASEYVALAHLPGIEKADVFEPMPEEVYMWTS